MPTLQNFDLASHATQLAYHAGEAEAIIGGDKLVRYSLLGGEQALSTFAHEDALLHFQRALAAKDRQPMDSETAQLLFGLGRAQAATCEIHQTQQAVANFTRSFNYYAEVGQVEQAVAVAEHPLSTLSGSSTGMAQLIERGLELVPGDSLAAGRLLSQYIRVLVIEEGDYQAAQEALPRALEIARREGDEALEMKILASATAGDVQYLRLQGSLVKSLRAIELAEQADDPRTEADARYFSSMGLWSMGHLPELKIQSQAALAPAGRLRDRHALAGALWTNEILAGLSGDWDSARELNSRCLAVSPKDPRPLYTRALLESETGQFQASQTHLDRFLDVVNLSPPGPTSIHAWASLAIPMIARITGQTDRLPIGETAAKTILSSPSAIPYVVAIARAGLGLSAVLRQDSAEAARQYQALESGRGVPLPATFMVFLRLIPGSYLVTSRLLGLLADTMGRPDLATSHLDDAIAFCRRSGCRPELAWSIYDYARVLSPGIGPDNKSELRALIDETIAISGELGMAPLLERATDLRNQLDSAPQPVPAYPDGLTQREVEVLRLLATGKTDRQIAADLFISAGTASTHVRNILNKTNAANRTEATAYAGRRGLL